jgi:hypothetical protein
LRAPQEGGTLAGACFLIHSSVHAIEVIECGVTTVFSHAACGMASSAARASAGFHHSFNPRSRAMMPAVM